MIISQTFPTANELHSNKLIYSLSNLIAISIITPYICIVFYGLQCFPHEFSVEPYLCYQHFKNQEIKAQR